MDLVIGKRCVHRQEEAALKEPLDSGNGYTIEAEALEAMHGSSSPLHDGSDPPLLKMRAQRVTTLAFDLVVLEDVDDFLNERHPRRADVVERNTANGGRQTHRPVRSRP